MCWSDHRYREYEVRRTQRVPMRVPAEQRASDADRQRVIDQLRVHTADGRLTLEEFEVRVGEAWRASTHGELRSVLRELPVAAVPAPAPARRRGRRVGAGVPFPMMMAILVVGGSLLLGHFAWWLIPLAFWLGGPCGMAGHRPRHSADDEELVSA